MNNHIKLYHGDGSITVFDVAKNKVLAAMDYEEIPFGDLVDDVKLAFAMSAFSEIENLAVNDFIPFNERLGRIKSIAANAHFKLRGEKKCDNCQGQGKIRAY